MKTLRYFLLPNYSKSKYHFGSSECDRGAVEVFMKDEKGLFDFIYWSQEGRGTEEGPDIDMIDSNLSVIDGPARCANLTNCHEYNGTGQVVVYSANLADLTGEEWYDLYLIEHHETEQFREDIKIVKNMYQASVNELREYIKVHAVEKKLDGNT
jgi:hypothetical protein